MQIIYDISSHLPKYYRPPFGDVGECWSDCKGLPSAIAPRQPKLKCIVYRRFFSLQFQFHQTTACEPSRPTSSI